ncbi:branched chain amino acid aminotransferase [Aerococcus urinaehominis]|uniref:Branched-chain-amino-acid aminotransferase n=1 Tax=Aerococcus urinaehominis TaxID=128944 RepID=A0A109RGI6_9LACT|nr:branched-chain amino acid aminotransferase [Aerococcus urinaehominis]AMB99310.1 branched chain amino acid aminotransferase [Aerococcus urinaehominis]SDM19803.1 branched-chain amino acid aminotransferase [Aerococcus urinaehominis]
MSIDAKDINFEELGFGYMDLPYRWRAYWKDGQWYKEGLEESNMIPVSEASTAFHYGQNIFEGMKAYRGQDDQIRLFRPDENAKRLNASARRLIMPEYPEEKFIEAVKETVKANADFVPPYGSGATLYIRPFMIGTGDNIGVGPAPEYIFSVFVMPVGPYFKGGFGTSKFVTSEYDRAAPHGTGAAKVAGNYGASLKPGKDAKSEGYADVVYLDPATHTKIEEAGSANFFVIERDGHKFVTPASPSILPSITKKSILYLAENRLGLPVEEGDIFIDDLGRYEEAGAMGTAAVISPIGSITHQGEEHKFDYSDQPGPLTTALYKELTGIQYGDKEAPEGWVVMVD